MLTKKHIAGIRRLERKHAAGIAVSMVLFGFFGLLLGNFAVVFTGLAYEDPVDGLATGPTPVAVSDVLTPFGLTMQDIGLSPDTAVILPGIPVTVEWFGVTLSVSGLTLAQLFGGGGAFVGFLIGLYYAVVFAYEQGDEGETDDSPTVSGDR